MKKLAVVLLILAVSFMCYQRYWVPVYITLDTEHRQAHQDDNILYFWTGKRHEGFFQVGKQYCLQSGQQTVQLALFSITYASLKPGSMKLGFRLPDNKEITAVADEYQVTDIALSGTL